MAIIKPFRALRPSKDKVAQVSAPSYDSTSRDKSHDELATNPYSYLHIVKPYLHFKDEKKNPEKHFPLGLDYLEKFKQEGFLIKENQDAYYIYRVIKGSNAYTGIIGAASVDDYENNNILKHENTLTEKQNEVADHINWFKQLGNPVLLTYKDSDQINALVDLYIENHVPEYNFISPDQLKHNVWVVKDSNDIKLVNQEFDRISKLYIADGHHRSAGACAYSKMTANQNRADAAHKYFPVCLIPFSKLHIYEYHRLVKDAFVYDSHFMEHIAQYFDVTPSGDLPVQPLKPKEFGIYFNKKAYLLKPKTEVLTSLEGILNNLDVSIVEEFILKRIFEINDSKTDKRISFIDGTKGIGTIQQLIDNKEFDLAITLYKTSIEEVVDIAEHNMIMPPKSTWIEPKIRTGLIIYETI
jgi:uncharacterized protein (DUF1015 family)